MQRRGQRAHPGHGAAGAQWPLPGEPQGPASLGGAAGGARELPRPPRVQLHGDLTLLHL